MRLLALVQVLFMLEAGVSIAMPTRRAPPTVILDQGTFEGITAPGLDKFLGIPFSIPPTGVLRFRLPIANDPYTAKTYSAAEFGPACPQQAQDPLRCLFGSTVEAADVNTSSFNNITSASPSEDEDCLTLNVIRPTGTRSGAKLPVVVWFFGGGFENGDASTDDGGVIVGRSIELNQSVIYVSMNYRVSAFGFLAGKEVKAAGIGNLGLHDQRLALRWVRKYISAFGGDPSKVTIWGGSAGAISVSLQMLTNDGNTEGLFRGAFMNSGSPIPVGDITNGQPYYDALVSATSCGNSSDTLECLREVPFSELKAAVDNSPGIFSPQSLALAWLPRADGVFLKDDPQKLVMNGSVANVPFVTGDVDDEGTIFAICPSIAINDEDKLRDYIAAFFVPNATAAELDRLLSLYPDDITQGSPFDTGTNNAIFPEYKRIAALLGDLVFQAPRRLFLDYTASKQNTWSFLSMRDKGTHFIGSSHGSDLSKYAFRPGDLTDLVIHFVNHLDPNGPPSSRRFWPTYNNSSRPLMTLLDGSNSQAITSDTYRKESIGFLISLSLKHPF
ncbi:carotenoid ester lipase precursor [Panus rudis PR-1116 ss-1]|nr:carotenoid ester lipase precursor [Panus rudis PR-1116 ss-1]